MRKLQTRRTVKIARTNTKIDIAKKEKLVANPYLLIMMPTDEKKTQMGIRTFTIILFYIQINWRMR